MNKTDLIQAVKERKPLIWKSGELEALVIPERHDDDESFFGHTFHTNNIDKTGDGWSLYDPENWSLATPEDLAKFPSYQPLEQPTPESEPLKGSTEEPLTLLQKAYANFKKRFPLGFSNIYSEQFEFEELLSASPLEPLHELPTDFEQQIVIVHKGDVDSDLWNGWIDGDVVAGNSPEDVTRKLKEKWMRSRLLPSNGWIPDLPENMPLYKDSGLWQLRSDDMNEVILQQGANEPDLNFFTRCAQYGRELLAP